MMPSYSEFVEFVVEQMSFIGALRVRAMFGGYGVYRDDRIFAIIVDDRLYFKADPIGRGKFEAKGSSPFAYTARGKTVTVQYFEAPPEVFEVSEAMRNWVQTAWEAAMRAEKTGTPNKARAPRSPRTRRGA